MRFRVRPPKNRELPLQLKAVWCVTGNKVLTSITDVRLIVRHGTVETQKEYLVLVESRPPSMNIIFARSVLINSALASYPVSITEGIREILVFHLRFTE